MSVYSLFEKGFLKHLHRKYGKRVTKENLVFAFHDLDGKPYYKFSKELGLPISRVAKVNEYYALLSAAVTGKELDKMLDKMDAALSDGLKNAKNISTIGSIIHALRERKNIILHDELYYNVIAVQVVRYDEMPNSFNNQIHMEKVDAFRRMDEDSDTFFLATSEYRELLLSSNTTREQLLQKLIDSLNYRQAESKVMNTM